LKFREILGISILLGPLLVTIISLTYVLTKTGIEDFILGQVTNIPLIDDNEQNPELIKYVEELKKIAKQRAIKKVINFILTVVMIVVFIPILLFLAVLSLIPQY